MSQRCVALLLTPILPLPGGSGPALRAWDWLIELGQTHRVHVLLAGGLETELPADYPAEAVWPLPETAARPALWRRAAGWLLPPLCLLSRSVVADWRTAREGDGLARALAQLATEPVARVVVFRVYLHDLALVATRGLADACVELDMDDLESRTRFSVAGSLWRMGRPGEALRCAATALQYALLERRLRGPYRTLWLAAAGDERHLRTCLAPHIAMRPNRIAIPPLSRGSQPSAQGTLRLLFVGTLSYAPNEEAVLELLDHILPALAKRLQRPWVLCVVGRHASPRLTARLRQAPRLEFMADAASLAECYAVAQVVVVPLKAGGGTKLKTLEAFAHQRPVVSTGQGVRGLDVRAGEHYLHAETPAEFAHAIARLAEEPELARRIARAGYALCAQAYARA